MQIRLLNMHIFFPFFTGSGKPCLSDTLLHLPSPQLCPTIPCTVWVSILPAVDWSTLIGGLARWFFGLAPPPPAAGVRSQQPVVPCTPPSPSLHTRAHAQGKRADIHVPRNASVAVVIQTVSYNIFSFLFIALFSVKVDRRLLAPLSFCSDYNIFAVHQKSSTPTYSFVGRAARTHQIVAPVSCLPDGKESVKASEVFRTSAQFFITVGILQIIDHRLISVLHIVKRLLEADSSSL